jgi:hypothetical protein
MTTESGRESRGRWIVGVVVALLAAGTGIQALWRTFGPTLQPLPGDVATLDVRINSDRGGQIDVLVGGVVQSTWHADGGNRDGAPEQFSYSFNRAMIEANRWDASPQEVTLKGDGGMRVRANLIQGAHAQEQKCDLEQPFRLTWHSVSFRLNP